MRIDRLCAHCNTEFTPSKPGENSKYCSSKCRVAAYRARKKDEEEHAPQQAVEQPSPGRNTPPVEPEGHVLNPAWQVQKQRVEGQQEQCQELQEQLSGTRQQIRQLEQGRRGASIGALIGVALVVGLMAIRYDNRRNRPLGVAFAVFSVFGLVMAGLMGSWAGQMVEQQAHDNDETRQLHLADLHELADEQQEELDESEQTLKQLKTGLQAIPKYIKVAQQPTEQEAVEEVV